MALKETVRYNETAKYDGKCQGSDIRKGIPGFNGYALST